MTNQEELQKEFFDEYGISWENSNEEPDIDYVHFLENKIKELKDEVQSYWEKEAGASL